MIVTGNLINPQKQYFNTAQGVEMNRLVHEHVRAHTQRQQQQQQRKPPKSAMHTAAAVPMAAPVAPPMAAPVIAAPVIAAPVLRVQKGRAFSRRRPPYAGNTVQLLPDDREFQASFRRFRNDPENGWSTFKHQRRGQHGTCTEVFSDLTMTVRFSDGVSFDLPWEAVTSMP